MGKLVKDSSATVFRVLVVDDDPEYGAMLEKLLRREGFAVSRATDCSEGLDEVRGEGFDLVLLDVCLPDGSGLALLPELRAREDPPEVIIITGNGDRQGAELAIKHGAWDYFQKGVPVSGLRLSVQRALEHRQVRKKSNRKSLFHAPDIIGRAPAFQAAVELAAKAAESDASVLVTGPTGTGKELFAAAIHANSSRARGPFVVVDCAALPDTLVGSVLFGHTRGAFTGANQDHGGLIAQANGGTLFLDEAGDMPLEIQKSFLRVLQDHQYRPLGAEKTRSSNFRVIAATHRNLDEMASQGQFRSDLLYRLRAITVTLPPLRKRMEDLRALAVHMVSEHCLALGRDIIGINESFFQMLEAYTWPGNVRELSQAIVSAIAHAGDETVLFSSHLPAHVRTQVIQSNLQQPASEKKPDAASAAFWPGFSDSTGSLGPLRRMRGQFEEAYMRALVRQSEGNVEKACQVSGLSRPHVYALLKKYGLTLH